MSNECSTDKGSCNDAGASANPCKPGEQECNLHEKLLCVADEAWKELLKDKIKEEIEKSSGTKLSALAKLVAETNGRKWQWMIQGKKTCDDYKTQVRNLLAE